MHASLQQQLASRESTALARVAELEQLAGEEEAAHLEAVSELTTSSDSLLLAFSTLDERVSRVGRTAHHVGDRLATVDAGRRRAETAVDLITALSLFNTDAPPALGPLFTNDARIAEAAALTQRLLELADLGTSAGLASCARALSQLHLFSNSLENRLVAQFDAAETRRDAAGMAAAAQVLTSFNGGASCVARFVASRPMFLVSGDADMPSAVAVSSEHEAVALATERVKALGAQFRDLLRGARDDATTVSAVFPNPGAVMATLVQRLLEQRVRGALEGAIPLPPPAEEALHVTAPQRMARLLVIAGAYERTMELAARLAALPGCSGSQLDASASADDLFVTWRDHYLDDELLTQRGLGEGDIPGVAGAEARMARAEDAMARCALLVRTPSARASAAATLLSALCVDVIRHCRAGIDSAAASAAALTKLHSATTPAATVVSEGAGALLGEAGSIRRFMAAFQEHLAAGAAPLLAAEPRARAAAADSTRQAGVFIEGALAACLQAAVEAASCAVERTLGAEQSRLDFTPRAVGSGSALPPAEMSADRPTVACTRAVLLLDRVQAAAAGALDAHNCSVVCAALASRLLSFLEGHLAAFRYTSPGGLRLKRDLAEYSRMLLSWGLSPTSAAQARLAELSALTNLLVAPRPALAGLLGGEGLGLAVSRDEALRFLALRDDYRRNDKAFTQLGGQ